MSIPVNEGCTVDPIRSRSPLQRAIANASIYTLGSTIRKGLTFALIPVYGWLLGPEQYGMLALVTMTLAIASIVSGLGLPAAAQWTAARRAPDSMRRLSSNVWALLAVSAAVIAGVAIAWRGVSGEKSGLNVWAITALAACLSNVTKLSLDIRQGLEESRQYLRDLVIVSVVTHGACVASVTIHREAGSYALGVLLANSLLAVYFVAQLAKRFPMRWAWREVWSALAFGVPLTAHALNQWTLAYIDRFLLERLDVPLARIGHYVLGYQIASIGMYINLAIGLAAIPLFQRVQDSGRRLQERRGQLAHGFTAIAAGIAVSVSLWGGELVRALLPQAFAPAIQFIPWIALGTFFHGAYIAPLYGLYAARRSTWVPLVSLLSAMSNVGLNLLLIPILGTLGAAVGTVLSYVVLLAGILILANRRSPLSGHLRPIVLAAATVGVSVVASLCLSQATLVVRFTGSLAVWVASIGGLCVLAIRARHALDPVLDGSAAAPSATVRETIDQ